MSSSQRSRSRKKRKLPLKQSWTAPKRLKMIEEDKQLSKRKWMRIYSSRNRTCKFYKTSHKFEEESKEKFPFFHDLMIEYHCRCGKKKIEFIDLN